MKVNTVFAPSLWQVLSLQPQFVSQIIGRRFNPNLTATQILLATAKYQPVLILLGKNIDSFDNIPPTKLCVNYHHEYKHTDNSLEAMYIVTGRPCQSDIDEDLGSSFGAYMRVLLYGSSRLSCRTCAHSFSTFCARPVQISHYRYICRIFTI